LKKSHFLDVKLQVFKKFKSLKKAPGSKNVVFDRFRIPAVYQKKFESIPLRQFGDMAFQNFDISTFSACRFI